MHWSAYMKHLQSILKKFDGIVALTDNLLIWYFWNGLRSSIYAQLDEKYDDLDDWQVIAQRPVDIKAKTAQQALSFVQKSDMHCYYVYRPLKQKEFKDPKNFKAKKNHFFITNRENCSQSGQTWD